MSEFGKRGSRFIDISGKKYNRLLVISFVGIKEKRAIWLFKCDCGNTKELPGKLVRNGHTKSCGCLWMESISLKMGESAINKVYAQYKLSASDRNYSFDLSLEQFLKLTQQNCYYCGVEPHTIQKSANGIFKYNGIDRINNSIGYNLNNCVSCCKICNIAKANHSKEKFLNWSERLYKYQLMLLGK